MSENLKNKILELKDQYCDISGVEQYVYKIVFSEAGVVTINTDHTTFKFPATEKELDDFLECVTVVKGKADKGVILNRAVKTDYVPAKRPEKAEISKNENHLKLETALMDMLDLVKQNKKAIPQAKAICEITTAMVNLEKQQIALYKATR